MKVEGQRVNVLEAKKKILEVLETRVSITYIDFPHLIKQFCQQYADDTLILLV